MNGDFADSLTAWTDEREGPGVSCGVVEVIDVGDRDKVLHCDSRPCANYYLFLTQLVSATPVLGRVVSFEWRLSEIESPYGLAAVWFEFLDASGATMGRYFIRRHTGNFPAYDCEALVSEHLTNHPGMFVGCEQKMQTATEWEQVNLSFDQAFFDIMEGPSDGGDIDPTEIESLKIWIQSYNNAGSGVEAWFDNFKLVVDDR